MSHSLSTPDLGAPDRGPPATEAGRSARGGEFDEREAVTRVGDGHVVCTIIAPNYLDRALVLGRSLAATMPDVHFRVLVLQDCADVSDVQGRLDDYLASSASGATHRALTVDECDWGDFDPSAAALIYDVMEFATSVKPGLMRHLLGEGWSRVTYLDPDIEVYADFAPLLEDAADLTLVPHFLSDIPADGERPSTYDVLMAGLYNLGFCSARPTSSAFLAWWAGRMQFECRNDHRRGYFTDQKILDMAPLKARVQVLRDPGMDVAYWNLHERRVVAREGSWGVEHEGRRSPLYFFHFSGFRLERHPSLSIHSSRPVLGEAVPRDFASGYDRRCRRARPASPVQVTLAGAALSRALPAPWRRAIREDLEVHGRAGLSLRQVREEVYPGATSPERCAACAGSHDGFAWRVADLLTGWATHRGLNGAPNGVGAMFRDDGFEFATRAMEQLAWASRDLPDLLRGRARLTNRVLDAAAAASRSAAGLTLLGYFTYPAGIGQIARSTLRILEAEGIHPAVERVAASSDAPEYLSALLRRDNPVAASNASALCFVNADQWLASVLRPARVDPRCQWVEAVWAWELEDVPTHMFEVATTGGIRRIHGLSTWSALAMGKVLPVPVSRFAPFDTDRFDALRVEARVRRPEGLPERYLLTTFDAKSHLRRKNPAAVLTAWGRIEAEFPEHWLVVKSSNLRDFASSRLLDAFDASPRTRLIDDDLTEAQYLGLLAHCEVYVSLHRSEGLGLTPIEAGLCELPVVYTNYGGVVDYLAQGFFPVDYSMSVVGGRASENGPYGARALWAEPDAEDAVRQLRAALATADDDDLRGLRDDRKRLSENLATAREEVVDTARRLLDAPGTRDTVGDTELAELLWGSRVPEDDREIVPNPLVFSAVAVGWRLYRRLPRAWREQVNAAIIILRHGGRRSDGVVSTSERANPSATARDDEDDVDVAPAPGARRRARRRVRLSGDLAAGPTSD